MGDLTTWYCVPGQSIFAGAWLGRILWLLSVVFGIVFLCERNYALIAPLVLDLSVVMILLGLSFAFLLVLIYINWKTDRDARRLRNGTLSGTTIQTRGAKWSHYNAAVDIGIAVAATWFYLFSVVITYCYWTGMPVTYLHATNLANAAYIYNYPITNTTAFPAGNTATNAFQVQGREFVHGYNFMVSLIIASYFALTRVISVIMQDQPENLPRGMSELEDGTHAAEQVPLNDMNGQQKNVKLDASPALLFAGKLQS